MFLGYELRRVVAAPPQEDPDFRVLTVEMYEDGLIVRWVVRSWEEARLLVKKTFLFTVRDDRGTIYLPEGGGGSAIGSAGAAHGIATFAPAVPPRARRLTVATDWGAVEFDLDQR